MDRSVVGVASRTSSRRRAGRRRHLGGEPGSSLSAEAAELEADGIETMAQFTASYGSVYIFSRRPREENPGDGACLVKSYGTRLVLSCLDRID